jgi:hypothetical protein
MPSLTKHPHTLSTKAKLEKEYSANSWEQRLLQAKPKRVDPDYEFVTDSTWYRRQMLVEHYEGDVLIAFTIDYILHDGTLSRVVKMLLVNGVRHIVP